MIRGPKPNLDPGPRVEVVKPDPFVGRGRELRGPKQTEADLVITVSGPSLIRWDRWEDNSFAVDAIRIWYDGGASPVQEASDCSTIGNYTYLPRAGRYTLHKFSWGDAQGLAVVGILYENVDPALAIALLTTGLPSFTAQTINITATNVAQRIDTLAEPNGAHNFALRACSAKISNNGNIDGGGAIIDRGVIYVGVGINASIVDLLGNVTIGHPLRFLETMDFTPQLVSGSCLTVISDRFDIQVSATIGYR